MDSHLRQLERLYSSTESPEIGAQLINALRRSGASYSELLGRFPASLVWDVQQGYPPGQTEILVNRISAGITNYGWDADSPQILIIGIVGTPDSLFRALWPNLRIPYLWDEWRMPGEEQTIFVEDIPTIHHEPVLRIANIRVAGSGGRQTSFRSPTKYVSVGAPSPSEENGIPHALELLDDCAYNIFHGSVNGPEQDIYGGGGFSLFEPPTEQD